jgi:hypothetical protein
MVCPPSAATVHFKDNLMAKSAKKKPARPASGSGAKPLPPVVGGFHPTGTRPADAGYSSAKTGGKSASNGKGR